MLLCCIKGELTQMKVFVLVLKNLLKEYRKQVFKCVCVMAAMSVIQLVIPLSMKKLVAAIEADPRLSVYFISILLYMLLWAVYNFINVKWYKNIDILGEGALSFVREKMYHKIWNCNYQKFYNYGINKLKNLFFTDVINVYANVIMYSLNIFAESVMILILLVASAIIDLSMTIVLTITVILGFGIAYYTKPKVVECSKSVNAAMKIDNATNNECIDAEELIRVNGLQEYYINKMKRSVHNFIQVAIQTDQRSIFLQNLLNNYNQIVVLIITGAIILTRNGNNPAFVIYYMYLTNLVIDKSQKIEDNLFKFMKNMASFDNIGDILELEEVTNEGGRVLNDINSIQFDNVSLAYEDNKYIFKNLSFKANAGDAILLRGFNGSGKSSVLKMIAGLINPSKGNIKYNDVDVTDISKRDLYRNICFLSQEELLLNESVKDYIEIMSHRQVSDKETEDWMQQVGLNKNFRTISDNGKSLSGGEKKKYLLLKLLSLRDSVSVVLIDEAEAGLDAASKEIMHNIERCLFENRDKYIIIKITHEEIADKTLYNKEICLTR